MGWLWPGVCSSGTCRSRLGSALLPSWVTWGKGQPLHKAAETRGAWSHCRPSSRSGCWFPGSFLLTLAISPLCLYFLTYEMGAGGLVKLTDGKALLGNTRCRPEAMAESALGLWTPPASGFPVWTVSYLLDTLG